MRKTEVRVESCEYGTEENWSHKPYCLLPDKIIKPIFGSLGMELKH